MAATARPHAGDHRAAQQHRRDQVDVDELRDLVGRQLGERAGEVDARVVDEHIDRPAGFDRPHERLDRGGVAEVGGIRVAPEVGGELAELLLRAGDEHDARTAARTRPGQRGADPSRRAGNHNARAAEVHREVTRAASRSASIALQFGTIFANSIRGNSRSSLVFCLMAYASREPRVGHGRCR